MKLSLLHHDNNTSSSVRFLSPSNVEEKQKEQEGQQKST